MDDKIPLRKGLFIKELPLRKGLFIKELPLIISKENQKFVDSYLVKVRERSDGAYGNQKCALKYFFENVNKSVFEIKKLEVIDFFNRFLNIKTYVKNGIETEISLGLKEAYRSYYTSFFSHVEQIFLNGKQEFNNPIPNKQVYQFTTTRKDIKKHSDIPKEILSNEQIKLILEYCKKRLNTKSQRRYFIFFSLLTITGARPMELLSIRIKDINLNECFFETGFEKNARKSTCNTKQALLFFFPKNFTPYLRNYIQSSGKDEEWLFPRKDPNGKYPYMNLNHFQYQIKKMKTKLGFSFMPKYFRKSLITNYASKEDLKDGFREGLMNHVGSSVEWQHYIKFDIPKKRAIFDKYFPYYDFPYF